MKPLFVLAHGAGAPQSSPWMQRWARNLSVFGQVHAFDYPYLREGRKRPDPLPVLLEAHRAQVEAAMAHYHGPLVYAGKSMGSRVGCHLAQAVPPKALICFGYPLVGMSAKPRRDDKASEHAAPKVRDEVLLALKAPILFLQGTRDPLCPLDLLDSVRKRMSAPNELYVVDTGNHSLEPTKGWLKREGMTPERVDESILVAIQGFLARWLPS